MRCLPSFLRGRPGLAVVTALAAVAAGPAHAQLGPVSSVAGAGCGPVGSGTTTRGPSAAGLQVACDDHIAGFSVLYGPYDYQAASSVNTGLERGGAVDANASVTMTGRDPYATWAASAGGFVSYLVRLAPLPEAPPQALSRLPVKFKASGEAHVVDGDGGGFEISAQVADPAFPFADFKRTWEGTGSHDGVFSGSTTLSFATADTAYQVIVSAGCRVSAWAPGSGHGSCTAAADPSFSFDQAAFDASMGASTFSLERYYRFEYSPGVTAVPEPGTGWLMATALLALAGWRRRLA